MMKNPPADSPFTKRSQALQDVVTTVTYIAIILNIGALVGLMQLIDELGRMPLLNACHEAYLKTYNIKSSKFQITLETTVNNAMGSFGLKGRWTSADWHCASLSHKAYSDAKRV